MHAAGADDGFECVEGANGMLLCRAKPGSALYPTNVFVVPLSTGSRIKLSVSVDTARDCAAAYPVTFKNGIPGR